MRVVTLVNNCSLIVHSSHSLHMMTHLHPLLVRNIVVVVQAGWQDALWHGQAAVPLVQVAGSVAAKDQLLVAQNARKVVLRLLLLDTVAWVNAR